GTGEKFTEEVERHVEAIMADKSWLASVGDPRPLPAVQRVEPYLNHLRVVFPEVASLGPFKRAVDCPNGATTPVAPQLSLGLGLACRESGIELVRTAVGDKYVMEEMLKRGATLGGEQSGHVIFSDYLYTGDGLCTALNVLRTIAMTGRSLADLASDITNYPQVLLNVRVREKVDLKTVPAVADVIARVEERVAGQGRILIRYSGTEPLLRVMLEGKNENE